MHTHLTYLQYPQEWAFQIGSWFWLLFTHIFPSFPNKWSKTSKYNGQIEKSFHFFFNPMVPFDTHEAKVKTKFSLLHAKLIHNDFYTNDAKTTPKKSILHRQYLKNQNTKSIRKLTKSLQLELNSRHLFDDCM